MSSTVDVTPSGVPLGHTFASRLSQIAPGEEILHMMRYRVQIRQSAPPELRINLELGREDAGVWAHIPELDVSAEGADINEAFRAVIAAARDWLDYIREGDVGLAPELAEQARYVPLLDAPEFSWFKGFRFAE